MSLLGGGGGRCKYNCVREGKLTATKIDCTTTSHVHDSTHTHTHTHK
jgi:hypothetical protein